MPERLPFAVLGLKDFPQDDVVSKAQAVHDGLLASIATFPTPPVLPAALQILIDNFAAALAAAVTLGVNETAAKNEARLQLDNALRVDAAYVNQLIYNLNASGTSYSALKTLITGTGYALSKDPIAPAPLPQPENFRSKSINKGQIKATVNNFPNQRGLEFWYRKITIPASPWTVLAWPNIRVTIDGLDSGSTYEMQCAYIAAVPTRNFTIILTQVVI